jgi:hypothetical protein
MFIYFIIKSLFILSGSLTGHVTKIIVVTKIPFIVRLLISNIFEEMRSIVEEQKIIEDGPCEMVK